MSSSHAIIYQKSEGKNDTAMKYSDAFIKILAIANCCALCSIMRIVLHEHTQSRAASKLKAGNGYRKRSNEAKDRGV